MFFINGSAAYVDTFPNPYLIIVIYAASRYGTVFGFIDAFINIIYMFISILTYYGSIDEISKSLDKLDLFKYPIIYLIMAFIFGILKDIENIRSLNLKSQVKEREKIIDDLNKLIEEHQNAIDNLREKLTIEDKGVSMLVEKLRDVHINKLEDVYNEGVELISNFIGAETVSIYNLEKNGFLRLKVRKGKGLLRNSLMPDDSIVIKYAIKNDVANINVMFLTDEESKIDFEPSMVSVIKSLDKIIGLVVVENIDVNKLNKNTESYLRIVSDWLSSMLSSSLAINKELEVIMKNKDGTIKNNYYEKFFEDYLVRWKKFKMPFSYLKIKANPETRKKIITSKRAMDIVFKGEDNEKLQFIFGICDKTGLEKIIERFKNIYGDDVEILERGSYSE